MNETLKTIFDLHSTHGNFSDKKISEETLEIIKKAAVRGANASNRQSYSVITVTDKEVMKEYLQYVGSAAMIFCIDFNRLEKTAEKMGHEISHGGIVDFVTGAMDTAILAQTAVLAARSLGVDTLLTNSVHRGSMERFYEKFQLPSHSCFPLVGLVLGYEKEMSEKEEIENSLHHKRERLDSLGIYHHETYHELSEGDLEQIISFYDGSEDSGLIFCKPEHRKKPGGYLEWYFQTWDRRNDVEKEKRRQEKDQEIMKTLECAGFVR